MNFAGRIFYICYVFGNCLFHKNAEFWYLMSECERCFSYIDLFEAFFGAEVPSLFVRTQKSFGTIVLIYAAEQPVGFLD